MTGKFIFLFLNYLLPISFYLQARAFVYVILIILM